MISIQVWNEYSVERVNHHIDSMSTRVEACIGDEGGNGFNF